MISSTNNTALTIGTPKTPVEVVTTKGILIDNFIDEVTDTTPTFKRLQEMWAELHPEDKPPKKSTPKLTMSNVDKIRHIMDDIKVSCADKNRQPVGDGNAGLDAHLPKRLSFMEIVRIITKKEFFNGFKFVTNFNGAPELVSLLETVYTGGVETVRIKRSNGGTYSFTRHNYENDDDLSIYLKYE